MPAGAAEDRFQLLDDLAVAAHRSVEALEVAVDHEDQVVEALARGQGERAQALRLVGLAVAHETPDPAVAPVDETPRLEIAGEAGLIDRIDRPQAHRHGRELPEVGHETRVRIAREALPTGLAPEAVELRLREASLEKGPGVDSRCGMPLDEDRVAVGLVVPAAEEVVESDFIEARRGGVGGDVPAQPLEAMVRARNHDGGVPPDEPADAPLHDRISGIDRLLLGADGVDVARLGRGRDPHAEHPRPLHQLVEEVLGAGFPFALDDAVESLDPLGGLLRVDVRELLLELVEEHRSFLMEASSGGSCSSGRPPMRETGLSATLGERYAGGK
jgi:hypothetical protein